MNMEEPLLTMLYVTILKLWGRSHLFFCQCLRWLQPLDDHMGWANQSVNLHCHLGDMVELLQVALDVHVGCDDG